MSEISALNTLDNLETPLGRLAVVGLNDEAPDLQAAARRDRGIRFRLLHTSDEAQEFHATLFPTSVLVVRGKVVDSWAGTRDDLREHVLSGLGR